jgi:hypothetical protein
MKNSTKLIIAAAIGGTGFLVYKNWDKISNMFKKKEEEKPSPEDEIVNNTPPKQNVEKTYTEYQKKVMKLQGIVGAGVDGDAGRSENSNTNKSVKAYFPNSYAKLGIVSPSNIDAYLALGSKKEVADTSRGTNIARALMVEKAWVGNKKAVIGARKGHKAVKKDNLTNTYNETGITLYVNANTILDKAKTTRVSSGYFITDVPAFYENGNPAVPPVRKVKISPFDIDVI